jgi:hypothetical protein
MTGRQFPANAATTLANWSAEKCLLHCATFEKLVHLLIGKCLWLMSLLKADMLGIMINKTYFNNMNRNKGKQKFSNRQKLLHLSEQNGG